MANIAGIDRYIAIIVIVIGVLIFSFAMCKEKLRAQMQYLDLHCLGMYILMFSINKNSLFVEDAHKIFFAVLSVSVIVICRKYKEVIPKKDISRKYIYIKLTFAVIIAGQFAGYQIFWSDGKIHVGFLELVCFILFVYWALFLLTSSEILMLYIGKSSIILYAIHGLDGWWSSLWKISNNVYIRTLLRMTVDLGIFILIIFFKWLFTDKKEIELDSEVDKS